MWTPPVEMPKPDLWYLPLMASMEEATPMRDKGHICRETGKVFNIFFSENFNKYDVMTSWKKRQNTHLATQG